MELHARRRGDPVRAGRGEEPGQSAVEAICKTRGRSGKFKSLHEFCEKVDLGAVNRRMIESLIRRARWIRWKGRGARSSRRWKARWKAGQRAQRDLASGQVGLFGEMMAEEPHGAAAECAGVDRQGEARRGEGAARVLGDGASARPLRG